MQPSRRAFLFGRQTPLTSWDAFLQRLGRDVQGQLRVGRTDAAHRARLVPTHPEDVRQARALCAEYGIALRLGAAAHEGDVLEVDPSSLNHLTHDPQLGQWVAQPGCRVGELAAAGLTQFRDAPQDWTLATWFASARDWAPGGTSASGVVAVDVLLSDGTTETLGPFGASDVRPLRSSTVQRLIPALFQLASSPDAALCRAAPRWPGCYRLDALQPAAPAEVNLAQVLLGHDGSLAWIEAITLKPIEWAEAMAPSSPALGAVMPAVAAPTRDTQPACAPASGTTPQDAETARAARRLQIRIKNAFDPLDLYGVCDALVSWQ